jgi:hypothetical protein
MTATVIASLIGVGGSVLPLPDRLTEVTRSTEWVTL